MKAFFLTENIEIIKLKLLFLKSNLVLKTYAAGLFLVFFLFGPVEIG